jgi:hypothetical protein
MEYKHDTGWETTECEGCFNAFILIWLIALSIIVLGLCIVTQDEVTRVNLLFDVINRCQS